VITTDVLEQQGKERVWIWSAGTRRRNVRQIFGES
jgi:hypothetical protein